MRRQRPIGHIKTITHPIKLKRIERSLGLVGKSLTQTMVLRPDGAYHVIRNVWSTW